MRLLDIYGFEVFDEENYFEYIFINFINGKVH